jgi:hypothetical protein
MELQASGGDTIRPIVRMEEQTAADGFCNHRSCGIGESGARRSNHLHTRRSLRNSRWAADLGSTCKHHKDQRIPPTPRSCNTSTSNQCN